MSYDFWVFGFLITLVGLCIGSFLNVVALRAFSGESIALPPSKCPACKTKLHWYNNIPVLSYILLRGKCQFCKCKISLQYPVVELSNALLYFGAYQAFGLSLKTLFVCILLSLFLVIMITDFKEKVVFDYHTYPLIALGLLYNILKLGDISILESILGIILGLVFFEATARLGYLFASTRAFGEGDTIIAMGLGAFFGWKTLIYIVLGSMLLQAVLSLPLLFINSYKKKNYKTCTALVLLVVCTSIIALLNYFNFYKYFYLAMAMLFIVFAVLLWCMKQILGGMKNKTEEELLYLPFGPALVFCAMVAIFYPALT